MAFCSKCGAQLEEGVKFCPSCGQSTEAPVVAEAAAPAAPVEQAAPTYTPPAAPNAPAYDSTRDANDNKVMAILAYILFFVPLIVGAHKTSPFVKYHTNQGTILFIAAAAFGIAYSILSVIFLFVPFIGIVVVTILGILWLAPAALLIIGIINAATGKTKELPIIGKFTIIK